MPLRDQGYYDERDDQAQDAAAAYAPQNTPFWGAAAQDYQAARSEYDGAPPGFDPTDWRDDMGQPTHPEWSCQGCDIHPHLYPVQAPDWSAGGGWLGQHVSGCRTNDPNCRGECGG
jgi:hypothetical protein